MGFLKIASDARSSAEPSKSEMGIVLDSSVSSTKEECPQARSLSFKGETSKPFNESWPESGCTAEPQQQTFFQKAHAKRLQNQYEQETTSEPCTDKMFKCLPTDSTNNSVVTNQKVAVKSEETQMCTWIRHPDTDDSTAKADSSLSTTNTVSNATQTKRQSANKLQCFTCPVCFNQIQSRNLSSFNQHIDKYLTSELDSKNTSMDGCQDVSEEENLLSKQKQAKIDHIHHKGTDLSSGSRTSILQNDEGSDTRSSTPFFENDAHSDFRTPFFKRFKSTNQKRSLVPHEAMGDSGSVDSHQTTNSIEVIREPLHTKVSTLTCPVCNQDQDTHDLILFNHHVDMCLNQEVLLEFREAAPPAAQADSKVKGQYPR